MDYSSIRKNTFMNYEKERKISEINKEVLNSKCLDCNNDNPEYISLNNAIFICRNCFKKIHQNFPSKISKTTRNNLKSLSFKDLEYLYFGGNKKMLEFMKYEYPRLINISSSLVYKTIALEYYRNWLTYLVEGGNKPTKPDIEIAYNSIDDKTYERNNFLNNNNTDVITIDFFNDCYNYNDKNNKIITNFIKKKSDSHNSMKNMNNNNNSIRLKFQTDNNAQKMNSSSNLKDFLNYYKTINKNNYEKYIQNTNRNYYKTRNNIFNNNEDNYYLESKSKRSIDNSFEKTDNNLNISTNENINYNNKILRAFKTNRIYRKPKRNFMKTFEKDDTNFEKKQYDLSEIKVSEVFNNVNNEIRIKRNKRDIMNEQTKSFEEKNKEEKNISNDNNNYNSININESNSKINQIKIGGIKNRYSRKRITNHFFNLNKEKDNKGNNKTNQDINEKDNQNTNVNEISSIYDNKNSNINLNKNDSSANNCNSDTKHNKYFSTVENLQSEFISRNAIDTTRDEGKSYEESYEDSQNTSKTISLNKSMRHFYSRHPRKMKKTITNRSKLHDESKRKEKKEKMMQLKKEKSEIIQSLKVLLKKKEQIKSENDNINNIDKDNVIDNNNDINNNYKTINNDTKKIFVNKIKTDELNKIIRSENKRNRRGYFNNEDDNDIDFENNNNNEIINQNKKIYVKKNEDFLKGDKDKYFIRNKYKIKKNII